MQEVYVIIVTHNGMKWLSKSLATIGHNPVIIVDNASTDGTVKFIKEFYPHFLLLEQERNLGFGKANNIGISEALRLGAKAVFLMNQDVYLNDNVISHLSLVLKNNPQYGIISPIHLNGKGNNLDKDFTYYCSANKKIFFDLFMDKNQRTEYPLPFINAAAWLISKKCLETVGGFAPEFFHYGEDENYCQRVLFHGFKIMIKINVFVRHDSPDLKSKSKIQFSQQHLLNYKKFLLLKYGNITKSFSEEAYIEEFKKLNNSLIKSLVKFDFTEAKGNLKKHKILKDLRTDIERMRMQTFNRGKHYLN